MCFKRRAMKPRKRAEKLLEVSTPTKPSTTQASSTFLTERHFKLLPLEDVGGNVGSGRAGGSAN